MLQLSQTVFVVLSYLILVWIIGVALYVIYTTITRREELLEREDRS